MKLRWRSGSENLSGRGTAAARSISSTGATNNTATRNAANNQFGIAEGRFVKWFEALVAGDDGNAEQILEQAIYRR
jgi:hypothetical protein